MSSRPILVIGPHRSGTSTVTRLINLMEAPVGEPHQLIGASDENPKGFWERADLIAANDALLASQEASWDHVSGWQPDRVSDEARGCFRRALHEILSSFPAEISCVLKDPRLCLTLNEVLAFAPEAICVFVYRPPEEVAVSLHKRNGIPLSAGLALWEVYTLLALNAAIQKPTHFIAYHDVLADPWKVTQTLYEALNEYGAKGLQLPKEAKVRDFVDESLLRSTPQRDVYSVPSEIIERARGEHPHPSPMPVSSAALALLSLYDFMDVYRAERETLNEQMTQLSGALHVHDSDERGRFERMMEQTEYMHRLIEERDTQLQVLNAAVEQKDMQLQQAQSTLQRLDVLLKEIENSTSWEVARHLIAVGMKLKGQSGHSSALDEARKLAEQ